MKIDRQHKPVVSGNPPLTWSWPQMVGTYHGTTALLNLGREPLLRIDLQWKVGTWQEPVFLSGRLMTRMLSEGTVQRTASEWTGAMDFWGAQAQFSIEQERCTATLYVLETYMDRVWPLFLEAILEPAFDPLALQSILQSKIQHWTIESRKVTVAASRRSRSLIYTDGHPEQRLSYPSDYESITVKDLHAAHRLLLKDHPPALGVCGPAAEQWISRILDDIQGAWPMSTMHERSEESAKALSLHGIPSPAPTLDHVTMKDAVQVALRSTLVFPSKAHPDYHGLKIMTVLLGGYFGSRLMQNLREDKGLTYGIGAGLRSFGDHALITIQSELQAGSAELALDEVRFEMQRLGEEEVGRPEFERVLSYLHGQWMAGMDGPLAMMDRYWDLWHYGLDEAFLQASIQTMQELTPTALRRLAQTYLDPDRAVVVVAGP
ncbi:MAG: M16 family metallopeptidase [Bacteroidota bacterium]